LSLIFDVYAKVWVVIVQGTDHWLYFSISRQQCLDYMA